MECKDFDDQTQPLSPDEPPAKKKRILPQSWLQCNTNKTTTVKKPKKGNAEKKKQDDIKMRKVTTTSKEAKETKSVDKLKQICCRYCELQEEDGDVEIDSISFKKEVNKYSCSQLRTILQQKDETIVISKQMKKEELVEYFVRAISGSDNRKCKKGTLFAKQKEAEVDTEPELEKEELDEISLLRNRQAVHHKHPKVESRKDEHILVEKEGYRPFVLCLESDVEEDGEEEMQLSPERSSPNGSEKDINLNALVSKYLTGKVKQDSPVPTDHEDENLPEDENASAVSELGDFKQKLAFKLEASDTDDSETDIHKRIKKLPRKLSLYGSDTKNQGHFSVPKITIETGGRTSTRVKIEGLASLEIKHEKRESSTGKRKLFSPKKRDDGDSSSDDFYNVGSVSLSPEQEALCTPPSKITPVRRWKKKNATDSTLNLNLSFGDDTFETPNRKYGGLSSSCEPSPSSISSNFAWGFPKT